MVHAMMVVWVLENVPARWAGEVEIAVCLVQACATAMLSALAMEHVTLSPPTTLTCAPVTRTTGAVTAQTNAQPSQPSLVLDTVSATGVQRATGPAPAKRPTSRQTAPRSAQVEPTPPAAAMGDVLMVPWAAGSVSASQGTLARTAHRSVPLAQPPPVTLTGSVMTGIRALGRAPATRATPPGSGMGPPVTSVRPCISARDARAPAPPAAQDEALATPACLAMANAHVWPGCLGPTVRRSAPVGI
mmetsp:Transcript_94937/g.163794  ORF Transcript_94937/g.163794 Transcript_94937/m.163794 type:complete len:245 (-) Transcript_94937:13746-14480(-)